MTAVILPRVTSVGRPYQKIRTAPGEGVIERLRLVPLWARSNRIDAGDQAAPGTTIQLFDVPAHTLVEEIIVDIKAALTGSPTVNIGDGGDTDRFFDSTTLAPGTAGMKSSKLDTQPGSGGAYIYTVADTIDMIITGTMSGGTIDVFLKYILDADELGLEQVVEA